MSKPIENRSTRARRPILAASLVVLTGALCAAGAAPVHAQQAGIRGTFDSSTDDRLLILRSGEAAADAATEPEGLQPGPYEPESDGGNPVNIFSLNGDEPGADGETGAGNASAAIPSGPSLREIQARRQKREQNTAQRLDEARTDRMAPRPRLPTTRRSACSSSSTRRNPRRRERGRSGYASSAHAKSSIAISS